jgi:nitrite reductase/ring-hydroxylating ferredoxin subunit
MEPIDGLAYIGGDPLAPDHLFLATGDSGHGMTHGALAGILISSLILGDEHPWTALYDPRRLRLRSAPDLLGAGLHAASKYLEWLPGIGESVKSTDDVPCGGGAIVHRHGRPVAVHRDDAGALHERSAVCPHLGCIVHWNDAEKSWDCPCHGSRFGPRGEVIHGPARRDLGEPPA